MLNVWIIEITDNLKKDEIEELSEFVSKEKRERIKRFHFISDAQNTLIADILIRSEICRLMGLDNKELVFKQNRYGKPYLDGYPDIQFNISHTNGYVACALDDEPVGIDIELLKSSDLCIAERFFCEDEKNYILNSDKNNEVFIEVWVKKESFIKRNGQGMSMPLDSFSVLNDLPNRVVFHNVFSNHEVICYVCTQKKDLTVNKMTISEFLSSLLKKRFF